MSDMTLEKAIQTAIEYETKVRDTYADAVEKATEDVGKKIFQALCDEEQGHLDYLTARFDEWERTGTVKAAELTTQLPDQAGIAKGVAKLEKKVTEYDWGMELSLLKNALLLESETGQFYKNMVAELDDTGKQLFTRFMEIEEAHYDMVQAQIDALQGMGYWYDFMEFDLEAG